MDPVYSKVSTILAFEFTKIQEINMLLASGAEWYDKNGRCYQEDKDRVLTMEENTK